MHLYEAFSPGLYASGKLNMPNKTDLGRLLSCLGQLIFSYYTLFLPCFFQWILVFFLKKCKLFLLSLSSLLSNIGVEDLFYVLFHCIGVDLLVMVCF